jgi:hypothetical protein
VARPSSGRSDRHAELDTVIAISGVGKIEAAHATNIGPSTDCPISEIALIEQTGTPPPGPNTVAQRCAAFSSRWPDPPEPAAPAAPGAVVTVGEHGRRLKPA